MVATDPEDLDPYLHASGPHRRGACYALPNLRSEEPVIFIDALMVKVRDGQVTNRPFYVVIGVTTAGERDILGIWAGDGGDGAKYWLNVLTEIKNRGVVDVCIAVCDGLKGLPEAIRRGGPGCGRGWSG